MGYMDESTEGYCEPGDIPRFVVEKATTGDIIELVGTIPAFENNMLYTMTLGASEVYIPNDFEVSIAYPNPFNPITNIEYGLPKESNVSISVYDVNGKLVEELLNKKQDLGYYKVTWDAREHATGLYFIKLIAGEYQNTQKVMLVK